MQPQIQETDYKTLFTQLIKKQMLVLGPDITLAKVRNVTGLTVDINGDVQKIDGDPQIMLQALINQFVELSGMIVKKTMESILTSYPGMMAMTTALGGTVPPVTVVPTQVLAPEPKVQLTEEEKIVKADVAQADSTAIEAPPVPPAEPPSMSEMKLDSLSPISTHADKPAESAESFSRKEMQDLNSALDQLSKAPLSTETPAASPQSQAN